MENQRGSKRTLAIGLVLAIVFDTAGQLLWKFTAETLPATAALGPVLDAVLRQPLILVLVGVFVCQLINWLKVLEHADLSYAQPITSLSYVSVCAISAHLFGEHIGLIKVAGILCILSGVWLVSQGRPLANAESGK
jgi:multidrug transporter EmrE-like cation transporter